MMSSLILSLTLCAANPLQSNLLKTREVWDLVTDLCRIEGYDNPKLVYAIIEVESGKDAWATRFEPKYRWIDEPDSHAKRLGITPMTEVTLQKFSYGLMQIMGGTARALGFTDHLTTLCIPAVNLSTGIKLLKQLTRRYETLEDVVSSYNQGSPRKDGNLYQNQGYVDKVLDSYNKVIPIPLS